jgi:Cof subfamily protein (haloacid dehalogenase superfamily)
MPRPRPAKISLVLADVDGTLVTRDKILTPRAVQAVEALTRAGIGFAITSGRPPKGMAMLIEPLAITTPIAGFNGGMFVGPDLSIIETRTLTPAAAAKAVALIEAHGLDVWVYAGEDWLIRDPEAPHVDREAWTVKYAPKPVERFTAEMLDHAVKIVGISDDPAKVEAAEKAAQEALGDTASAARSQPYYLDVTNPHANKAAVVEYLSDQLGIPAGEIATLGDMPNDVLMFKPSGLAIAMGNASAEVQAEADLVTDSHEDDGFAKAIERFVLA